MASSFLYIASRKVKPGGRIGFVLPITAAAAYTWRGIRQYVERNFTDIIAITIIGMKLSADTHINEMLLVAERKKDGKDNTPSLIKCVSVKEPIVHITQALETARAILEGAGRVSTETPHVPIMVGNDVMGHVTVMDSGGNGAPWYMLGSIHSDLGMTAGGLCTGTVRFMDGSCVRINTGMTTIDDIFAVGPTHHLIGHRSGKAAIGAFELHKVTDEIDAMGYDRILWEANAKEQTSLVVLPTHKGITVEGVGTKEKRTNMRRQRSTLFYARGMRWNSQALLAATTERSVMGGRAWTALIHEDKRVLKAAALWFNSTFGLMIHWTQALKTQKGRGSTQVGAVKKIPCPRFDRLDDDALDLAVELFHRAKDMQLLSVYMSDRDGARADIDDMVRRIFKLGDISEETNILRQLFCKEPSILGHKR